MEFLKNHPEFMEQLEDLCKTRRDEILSQMLETDKIYKSLCLKRTNASISLKKALNDDNDAYKLFEEYSDAICAQEIYELDTIYKQALYDLLNVLIENKQFANLIFS